MASKGSGLRNLLVAFALRGMGINFSCFWEIEPRSCLNLIRMTICVSGPNTIRGGLYNGTGENIELGTGLT